MGGDYIEEYTIPYVWCFVFRLVSKASTLRENAEESVVGMKWDTDVEAG